VPLADLEDWAGGDLPPAIEIDYDEAEGWEIVF